MCAQFTPLKKIINRDVAPLRESKDFSPLTSSRGLAGFNTCIGYHTTHHWFCEWGFTTASKVSLITSCLIRFGNPTFCLVKLTVLGQMSNSAPPWLEGGGVGMNLFSLHHWRHHLYCQLRIRWALPVCLKGTVSEILSEKWLTEVTVFSISIK